jgi:hypothetical protein
MHAAPHPRGPLKRRRAIRRSRALDRAAVLAEFDLEPAPRGMMARLRAYARSVEDLEHARVHAHLWAGRPRATPAPRVAIEPAGDAAPKRTAPH